MKQAYYNGQFDLGIAVAQTDLCDKIYVVLSFEGHLAFVKSNSGEAAGKL